MPATRREERAARDGECRRCRSFCDKLVEPRGCVEMGCSYLYTYVDMLNGEQYLGCMQEVFGAEVQLSAVLAPGGFGGVKMTGSPLPQCQFSVERAYEGTGPAYDCVNPRFFDCTDQGPEGIRAFDLRNVLAEGAEPGAL
ncbi:MAG TPA: hypothetical protein VKA89_08230 [Solirubrobacterales bacterium]|nr:hypothetical protein [Solirubrobacterales bacterium]